MVTNKNVANKKKTSCFVSHHFHSCPINPFFCFKILPATATNFQWLNNVKIVKSSICYGVVVSKWITPTCNIVFPECMLLTHVETLNCTFNDECSNITCHFVYLCDLNWIWFIVELINHQKPEIEFISGTDINTNVHS